MAFQLTAGSPAQEVIIENEEWSGSDSESMFAFPVKKQFARRVLCISAS
jgi:hypothetical protein